MIDGFSGQTVRFTPVSWGERDGFGNPSRIEGEPFDVADVLVAPATVAAISDGRPYGAESELTIYMSDPGVSLRGATAEVGGESYDVVGMPMAYPADLVPGGRSLVVDLKRQEG